MMNGLLANFDERYFIPILVWSLCWKAYALWKSARRTHKYWFVAILVLNTLGLLEIFYLVLNREKKEKPKAVKVKKSSKPTRQ